MRRIVLALFATLTLLTPATAQAPREITIGRATEPSSLDPLFSRTGNNQMTAQHVFDRLVTTDRDLQVQPGLAVSWRTLDPTTWEIKLRPNVTFHDGRPFTAADVIFSFDRARRVPNSPAPFTAAVAAVTSVEAPDPLTLIVKTRNPTPLLMEQIGIVYIVSKAVAETATSEDFNRGRAMVGTGPYRFVEFVPANRLVLAANPNHWSGAPAFERVTMRFISSPATRVAALLSGQVDVIDEVPVQDLDTVRGRGFTLASVESGRVIYLALDLVREESPFVFGPDGTSRIRNPLRDVRVRRALSMMIDRRAIVDRLLQGAGEPTAQMVPRGILGHDPEIQVPRPDIPAARRLLAEAGFPNGFGLAIQSSSDRFPGDRDLGQAIASSFTRGGLRITAVEAKTFSIFATEATNRQYSAFVFSFGTTTSNAIGAFSNVLATFDREAGLGAFNRVRWSNPAFDTALREAMQEFDPARREAALRRAGRIAADEVALIPLYFQRLYWATRPGLAFEAGKDEATLAMRVIINP